MGTVPHYTVYRLYDKDNVLLYVGCTGRSMVRIKQHEAQTPWFTEVARIEIEHFGNDVDGAFEREQTLIGSLSPRHNRSKPSPPPMLPIKTLPGSYVTDNGGSVDEDYMALSEAARFLGLKHPGTLRAAIAAGKIHGVKVGKRLLLVSQREVNRYREEHLGRVGHPARRKKASAPNAT
jgi:excisionase family DNA binding protein